MSHLLYIFVISIIKIYYIIYLWKNKKLEIKNSPIDNVATLALKLAACIKGACVAGGASATILGLGFGLDKLLEEAGYAPFFKKAVGNKLGQILDNLGYSSNSEFLDLQNRIYEIKKRVRNIDELNKILNEINNDDSLKGLSDELKEFKEEFNEQLRSEKELKKIEQSKILARLKDIKKNT